MYKIIIAYILGIIVEINFATDKYFLVATFLFFILSYIFFLFYKGHIKDTRNFIKDIAILTSIFLVFLLSTLYTKHELGSVSYKHLTNDLYETSGVISTVKQQNKTRELVIKVSEIKNLQDNSLLTNPPEYISVQVSPLNDFEIFDTVRITGEINFKNWQNYYENKPMFFSYEFMKLSDNSFYNVSYPKHIEKNFHQKNIYETVIYWFHTTSDSLKNKIGEHMSEPYAAIAEGISVGEQDNLQKDIKDIFKNSGLIHILVLSGTNIVFIISIVWYFLKRLKNRFLKISGAIIFSWVFIFMTGFTAPSVRAGVMSTANIFAEYFSKNIAPIYSLLFSLFILTLVSPLNLIYSASLHLSFLACFGLFIISPKIEIILKKVFEIRHNFLTFLFATFVGIFVTITPYLLALVGTTSVFGTLLTFLAEPFIMLTTILSFLIILFSFMSSYLADFFGLLNTLSTKIILHLAEFGVNNLPQISFHISETQLIIYYLILLLVTFKNDIIQKNESK